VAIAGLAFSALGCAESKPPAPAPVENKGGEATPPPAEPAPTTEEKK
jgi:hypothetical protein